MEKQLIRFAGRKAMKHPVLLGYEGDNLVERLEFELPEITAGQTATLMITGADAVTLDRTDEGRYAVDLTRDMIGPDGEREAYIRIDGAGGAVWQSAPMRMTTGALPDVEEKIEKQYPTAVGQMLTAISEHRAEIDKVNERLDGVDEDVEAVNSSAQIAVNAANVAQDAAERAADEVARQINDDIASIKHTWSSKAVLDRLCPAFRVSGSIVQCNPVERYSLGVVSNINLIQTGSGDPYPAGGGKNLFDPDYFAEQAPAIQRHGNGIVFTTTPSGIGFFFRVELALKPNVAYSISAVMSNSLNAPDVHNLLLSNTTKPGDRKRTVTTADDGVLNVYVYVNYANADVVGQQISAYYTDVMLAEGSAAVDYAPYSNIRPITGRTGAVLRLASGADATYEPYQGETFTTQFGQTVYGGELNWNTGILVSDKKLITFDGTEAWYANNTNTSGYSRFALITDNALSNESSSAVSGVESSHYKEVTPDASYNRTQGVSLRRTTIYIYDSLYADKTLDEWKSYLAAQYAAGTPVQVCYKLAEPTTIQLPPQDIAALAGVNSIWSDTGDTTVIGRTDPVYALDRINARLAALEAVTVDNI